MKKVNHLNHDTNSIFLKKYAHARSMTLNFRFSRDFSLRMKVTQFPLTTIDQRAQFIPVTFCLRVQE